MKKPVFPSEREALLTTVHLSFRHITLAGWMFIWLAHLTAAAVFAAAMWVTDTTAAEAAERVSSGLAATIPRWREWAGWLGLSLLGALGAYAWLLRKANVLLCRHVLSAFYEKGRLRD